MHQEEEVDFLLRNLPNLQVLNGLVVERDAIFSEDEECGLNSDAPISSTDNIMTAGDIGAVPQENANNSSVTQATISPIEGSMIE